VCCRIREERVIRRDIEWCESGRRDRKVGVVLERRGRSLLPLLTPTTPSLLPPSH